MLGKNKLVVKINNKDYTITSQESREYMLGVADLVDRKMRDVTFASPELNTTFTAVLAALNLADDYVRLQRANETLQQQVNHYAELTRRLEKENEELKRRR